MSNEQSVFAPINPATGETVQLALQELNLSGTVLPVGATLQVRHLFKSAEKRPIEVVYAFGLPRDATLRRFRIVGKVFTAESELKPIKEAAECYERGIAAGSLSTLARQYQDGIVNLSVGNVRPGETVAVFLEILSGVELRDDGLRFRFPFTLAPGYHGEGRMVESAPGQGELELPESFEDLILPIWMKDASNLHRIGFDLEVDLPQVVAEIGSPSHAIKVANHEGGRHRVCLAPESEIPNRDLVLDIRTREARPQVVGGIKADGTGHFALTVPSAVFGKAGNGPRRIVFLIDRSGSMEGRPMKQALQAVEACLGTLSDQDSFGLVAFDSEVESLGSTLLKGDSQGREAARKFLGRIDARGGTELAAGFNAAARLLNGQGGDVMIITDGQVFGTGEILNRARATGVRLHCLGIGSASQDRFLSLLARETGGISRFLTPRERVDLAAVELFAGIGCPVASGIRIDHFPVDGLSLSPEPPSVIRAGEPLMLFGELKEELQAEIRISWDGDEAPGSLSLPIPLEACHEAESVFLLHGSRLITDAESRVEPPSWARAADRRQADRQTHLLENLSRKYGLASRAMSLVAVVKRKGDKANEIPKTKVVPVGMPQDTAFGAYFGTGEVSHTLSPSKADWDELPETPDLRTDLPIEKPKCDLAPIVYRRAFVEESKKLFSESSEEFPNEDLLIRVAALIESDGGIPGRDDLDRWIASTIALFLFMEEGNTETSGTFRLQVKRLIKYVTLKANLITDERTNIMLVRIQQGKVTGSDWAPISRELLERGFVDQAKFWSKCFPKTKTKTEE